MTEKLLVDDNYWPYPLRHISNESPVGTKHHVVVAEISRPCGPQSYRHLYTALAPTDLTKSILNYPGGIGHDVTTTGPHPASFHGSFDYEPRFSIWAGEIAPEGLEPLVIAWEAGGRTTLLPDQGFLMTYGLVPRTVKSELGDLIHWDDLERPQHDVVIAKMVSEYSYELKSEAAITIDYEYLQDYATLRNRSLLQVFYVMNSGPLVPEDRRILSGKDIQEFKLKGRLVDIRIDPYSKSQVIAQVWGVRHLLDPLNSPITEGRWDYGRLTWPGIEGEVTREQARCLGLEYVYVDDSVLQCYEERPDKYSIVPDSGGVSYEGQWSVSYCQRVTRNLIKLEIKKLYERCPPDVVKHWHRYAVGPPVGNLSELMTEPNVASRSKRIVYALVNLGEAISKISKQVMGENLTSQDFVKLSRSTLDHYGWWSEPNVSPITRHIPLNMGENEFLERCKDLSALIVEGLNESNIRKLLLNLGVDSKDIKRLRELKLLDTLIQYALISRRTGLDFVADSQEIEKRRLEMRAELETGQHLETPIDILFVLYDLRIGGAHRRRNIAELLERLGTDKASVDAGMGKELDRLYDSIAKALEQTTQILSEASVKS